MPEAGIRGHHLDYLLQIDRVHMACEQAGYSPYEARAITESQVREWMEDTYDNEMQYMRDIMRVANRLDLPYAVNPDGTLSIESDHLRAVLRNMNQQETEFTYSQTLEM